MCTTSAHRFHHHSMDTLLDNPCVRVLWPTVHQSAFPEAAFWDMSHIHECLSRFCWLLKEGYQAVRSHMTL